MKIQILSCFALFIGLQGCIFTEQKPAEVVKVVAPKSAASKIDPSDSTYLRITLTGKEYKISLLNDSLITKDINGLDSFITIKKTHISDGKIVVTGSQNPDFNALKDILIKHKYLRFQITTDGE